VTPPFSENWVRTLLARLPFYVWTSDAQGVPTFVDPRLLALLGVDSAAAAGAGWFQRVHPDDRETVQLAWRGALSSPRDFREEYRLALADGTYRWFEARGAPVFQDDGSVAQWVGSIDDVEKDVATRAALRAEQLRLAKTADASPGMLYSFWSAPDGQRANFPYVSPAFCRLFQVDPAALAVSAESFFRLGHPEDIPGVGAATAESARNLTLFTHQWRVKAAGVGEIWVEARSMPVRETDGSTTWHGTLSDITARRHNEFEIRELNANLERRVAERTEELEMANRELEAFSYSVSHDLREPLRAVNGFSQALLDDFGTHLPDEGQRFVDNIRKGALRMGRLIDDLLAFSRLSRQPIRRRCVDVKRVVDECIHLVKPVESKATVSIGELADCDADPALLQQVFTNLLSNAFKYSHKRETPVISVDSQRDGSGAVVYFVRDNGTGFDMKYAGKLFQVFQRLHGSAEFDGTGVGLAVVHRIVQRHGGRIWAESAPDEGATFFFTLGSNPAPSVPTVAPPD
jgi:PAS domain S-box-containing protein